MKQANLIQTKPKLSSHPKSNTATVGDSIQSSSIYKVRFCLDDVLKRGERERERERERIYMSRDRVTEYVHENLRNVELRDVPKAIVGMF